MRKISCVVSVLMLMTALFGVVATPASASADGRDRDRSGSGAGVQSRVPTQIKGTDARMRACPWLFCTVLSVAYPNQSLTAYCFKYGDSVNDVPEWDVIYNASTRRVGFVSETLLTQINTQDYCDGGLGAIRTYLTGTDANMRACASTSCAISGTAYPSHTLYAYCWIGGQSIGGNPYWDVVYNATTGRVGFTTETLLTQDSSQLC